MEVSLGIYAVIFIFFYLVIPGFIYRRSYYNGEFSKQINWSNNSLSNFLSSLFIGIVLQSAIVLIFNSINSNAINIDSILNDFDINFIKNTDLEEDRFNGFSKKALEAYIPYLGIVYFLSAVLGFFSNQLVITSGLDTKLKIFRFSNTWHYLFSGKILKLKRNHKNIVSPPKMVKYVYVDALVAEGGDKGTLYSGLFADYEINSSDVNKLEKLHLFKAVRYKKLEDGQVKRREIPGDIFTIMGDKIININTIYIQYDKVEEATLKFVRKRRLIILFQILFIVFFSVMLFSFLFSYKLFDYYLFDLILSKSLIYRLVALFMLNMIIGLFTPFTVDNQNKKINFIGTEALIAKIIVIAIIGLILFITL